MKSIIKLWFLPLLLLLVGCSPENEPARCYDYVYYGDQEVFVFTPVMKLLEWERGQQVNESQLDMMFIATGKYLEQVLEATPKFNSFNSVDSL